MLVRKDRAVDMAPATLPVVPSVGDDVLTPVVDVVTLTLPLASFQSLKDA